jgi:peptidoglycan/xylan/chitin deacetylase (PgdA/CDA1 family)
MADLQITIDDGPEPVATALEPILDQLDELEVVAAFFVVGKEVRRSPDAAARICSRGHVLGNHSWDHLSPRTSGYTDAEILEQFRRTHEAVRTATGVSMRHWRAPRLEAIGRLEGILTRGAGALYGVSHCDVHADSEDSLGAGTAGAMLEAIRKDFAWQPRRQVFRLLFHVKESTARGLGAVIEGLVAEGHRVVGFEQER